MLYVNLYCGRLTAYETQEQSTKQDMPRPGGLKMNPEQETRASGSDSIGTGKARDRRRVGVAPDDRHQHNPAPAKGGLHSVTSRTRQKTREKPASLGKAVVTKLVQPIEGDIDGDAEDRQRAGVQSLGRAFAILEEVARHREGVGLADLSKLVGLHNSTTFHLAKTLVSLGYLRQEKESKR